MKTVMKLLGAALLLCLSSVTLAGEKTAVCHIPPGNMAKFHTIMVSDKAVAAHLKHGDKEGACGLFSEYLCDDNDPCTIDAFSVGTESCAPSVQIGPISDNNNTCTFDACTTGVGHEYLVDPDQIGLACTADDVTTGIPVSGICDYVGECVPELSPHATDADLADCASSGILLQTEAEYGVAHTETEATPNYSVISVADPSSPRLNTYAVRDASFACGQIGMNYFYWITGNTLSLQIRDGIQCSVGICAPWPEE